LLERGLEVRDEHFDVPLAPVAPAAAINVALLRSLAEDGKMQASFTTQHRFGESLMLLCSKADGGATALYFCAGSLGCEG
jgi:hypothetical protein